MKRLWHSRLLVLLGLLAVPLFAADGPNREKALEGLKALNDFIGAWDGNGGPPPGRRGTDLWTESLDWSWRFKGNDVWIAMKIKNGKYFKSGDMRYLPDKKVYQFTAADRDGHPLVFVGHIKNHILILEREDPKTKQIQQLKMNVAGDGVRFIYSRSHNRGGKSLFIQDFQVACNKKGESLASKEKKNVCIVTGGLGTIAVNYQGQVYYVCCTGCRDAFQENPEKFIKEFNSKKKD